MDNLCHTLAGLCIGEAGLRRKTPLAVATLVIGANLPDIDVLAYTDSAVTALWFRRGWTHGILAMAAWPLLLAALMTGVGRILKKETSWRGLLVVSAAAVWSHPLLDLLNTYGVRLLMPFSDRWFYGDALFIIDPWVWAAFLFGAVAASRRKNEMVARGALALAAVYMVLMAGLGVVGRTVARRDAQRDGMTVTAALASPMPATPFSRWSLLLVGDHYLTGTVRFAPVTHEPDSDLIAVNRALMARAAATPDGAKFLAWARFPYAVSGPNGSCPARALCLRDARYEGQGWAEVVIPAGLR